MQSPIAQVQGYLTPTYNSRKKPAMTWVFLKDCGSSVILFQNQALHPSKQPHTMKRQGSCRDRGGSGRLAAEHGLGSAACCRVSGKRNWSSRRSFGAHCHANTSTEMVGGASASYRCCLLFQA